MTVKDGKLTLTDKGTLFRFTELTARKLCVF